MRILATLRTALAPGPPLLGGFALLMITETLLFLQPPDHVQPIAFNHAKHIAAGLNCTDCHTGARVAEHATIPPLATCMSCHENPLSTSPEEGKLRAFAAAGREVGWAPVTRVPSHVYFSHRRHTSIGGIECANCHGAMETLTSPPRRPLRPVSMNNCIQCHQERQVRTDCNDCHR